MTRSFNDEGVVPFGVNFASHRNAFIGHCWVRKRGFRDFVLLLFGFFFASFVRAENLSLDEIRSRLVGKEVIVMGAEFSKDSPLAGFLLHWKVSPDAPKPAGQFHNYVPASLKGKLGIVLSVELVNKPKPRGNDPFGKPLDDSPPINPYINVEVKMNEGDLRIYAQSYYSLMVNSLDYGELQIAAETESLRVEVESILEKIIGKTLYKDADTKLFDSKQSLADLLDDDKRAVTLIRGVTNLTPMKVIDASFFPIDRVVVVEVQLPNNETGLLFGKLLLDIMLPTNKGFSPLTRLSISAAENLPKNFSRKELDAIRERKIFRGMSEKALRWSWGRPQTVNDWGVGGKQLVYGAGNYVYVNGNRVRDWQSIK